MVRNAAGNRDRIWFAAWFLAGACYSFALLVEDVTGIAVLFAGVVATVILARHAPARRGAPGLVSGLGLPFLGIAYLNRGGPGNVCTTTGALQRCVQELSPWPWLGAGVALVAGGCAVYLIRQRRERPRRP